ncbi:MAG: thermonuclease family protein [Moorea sp. SIO4G2]|nr:thermonuclease family protein [Moorena sp. SIO4G2]
MSKKRIVIYSEIATVILIIVLLIMSVITQKKSPSTSKSYPIIYKSIAHLPTCSVKPGSVYDGDTIRVICDSEEKKIRFACVDAPEKAQLLGIESRDHLRKVLEDGRMKVKVDAITTDRYGRTVAELWVNRGDDWSLVQSIQSSDGMVWGYEAYKSDCPNWDAIVSTQRRAQSARIGVWAGKSVPPWEWRKANRR